VALVFSLVFDSQQDVALWLSFDERRYLHGGAGMHRLTMEMRLDARHTLPTGTPLSLGGHAWLHTTTREYLGRWTTEHPVAIREQPFSAALILDLNDDQLALIEQRRAKNGGNFSIDLDVQALVLPGLPPAATPPSRPRWPWRARPQPQPLRQTAWPIAEAQHTLNFTHGPWFEMLAGINYHASLSIVAPMPTLDPVAQKTAARIREALRLIGNNEPEKAVVEARRAIEAMNVDLGDTDRSSTAIRAIVGIKATDRTVEQRLALLEHALHSLSSPAAHGDRHATTFDWNRQRAILVVAAVNALAACQPEVNP